MLHPALLLGAFPSNTSDLIFRRGRKEHFVTDEQNTKVCGPLDGAHLMQNLFNIFLTGHLISQMDEMKG